MDVFSLWFSLKPVSHQPCGSRAPVRVDKFLDFLRQPHGVVYYTARLSYEKQGREAAATNFRHVHFLCDLHAFSERCTVRQPLDTQSCHKAVARLLQDTQGVRTTDVIVRQPRICLTSAARLPQGALSQGCRKNAAKRTAAVRDTYDVSFCLATV